MRVLILAGGFGTRLKSVISNVPKALAPVDNVPFLEYQIVSWIRQGAKHITMLLHHESAQMITFLKKKKCQLDESITLDWIVESEPLGTGGAVRHAILQGKIKLPFTVLNADTWLPLGISALESAAPQTIVVTWEENVSRYGEVIFGDDRKVITFEEKKASKMSGWINTGAIKLDPEFFLGHTKKNNFSLESEFLAKQAQLGNLSCIEVNSPFIDIGIPSDFKKIQQWAIKGNLSS